MWRRRSGMDGSLLQLDDTEHTRRSGCRTGSLAARVAADRRPRSPCARRADRDQCHPGHGGGFFCSDSRSRHRGAGRPNDVALAWNRRSRTDAVVFEFGSADDRTVEDQGQRDARSGRRRAHGPTAPSDRSCTSRWTQIRARGALQPLPRDSHRLFAAVIDAPPIGSTMGCQRSGCATCIRAPMSSRH